MQSNRIALYYLVNLDPKAKRILAVDPPNLKEFVSFNKDFAIFKDLTKATCYFMALKKRFYPVDAENKEQDFFFAKINQRFSLTSEDW